MSQQKLPFKALNKHLRFALVLIFNLPAPGFGNLLLIGFNMANIFSAALSVWIWSKHNPLLLSVWLFLLAARAFGDIYLHRKEKHQAAHAQHNSTHSHEQEHARPQTSQYLQSDRGADSSNHPQHSDQHPNYHPPQAGSHSIQQNNTVGNPQSHLQQGAHQPELQPAIAANSAAHKAGWDPKFHLHENKEHEQPALKPLQKIESLDPTHAEAHPHRAIVHQTDPLAHADGAAQFQAQELKNDQEAQLLNSENHNRHLSHAELPFESHETTAHATKDSADDAGVVFDIYGEEDEEADAETTISPIKDGFYHDVHAADPSKDPSTQTAVTAAENTHEHSSNHLKAALDEQFSIPIDQQKKRVQLCSNCQRPREHHRPKCPTCGTHFED